MALLQYLILGFLICYCEAFKVLVVYSVPGKSHAILGNGLVKHLLNSGFEVTYITPFEYKDPPPNLRLIDVSTNFEVIPSDFLNLNNLIGNKMLSDLSLVKILMIPMAKQTFENENVQKLLNDTNENFDAVIVEWMFVDIIAGFATVFDCPLIWTSSIEVNADVLRLIDASPNPAYIANALTESTTPFSFKERVKELWTWLKLKTINFIYYDGREAREYENLVAPFIRKRGREPPSYNEIRYNASLVFGNSHVSMGEGIPIPQNYIPIGGFHIDEKVKPLPENLKKIMDNSKDGVIYFSMGSNLKSKDWPESIKRGLLELFGELKQTVLWKFEENLADVPKNVHILQWAPQAAILSHPNCVLFISHGGLLSTTETIHYGVPIIGIPVFGDQFSNVKRSISKGFALEVELTMNLVNDLKSAIKEILTNPRYKERVKELSFIYHDRPVKPGAELVHWVKHVIRTRGALHLRSPALHVPLYQLLYLDLGVIILGLLVVILIPLKYLCRLVCSKKKSVKQKKN